MPLLRPCLLASFVALPSLVYAVPGSLKVWHLTDVHVDPYFTLNANADGCYCEITEKCQTCGKDCVVGDPTSPSAAMPWGNSEGNCATPQQLYTSAVEFMAASQTADDTFPPMVYFTGDFVEAGATAPCHGSDPATAQQQVLDIIHWDIAELNGAFSNSSSSRGGNNNNGATAQQANVAVFPSFGNHDSVPGDVYVGTTEMQWLYKNMSDLWAPVLEADGRATVELGGWYISRGAVKGALRNLAVVSLNVNYWVLQNPTASKPGTDAHQLGDAQFEWLEETLAECESRGDSVHILGHQPPVAPGWDGGVAYGWVPGRWLQFAELATRFNATVKAVLLGHDHNDFLSIIRSCHNNSASPTDYVETTGIKWCSGGGDYAPGNVFNAGVDGICPMLPNSWTDDKKVGACESVCSNTSECVGFTYYPAPTTAATTAATRNQTECCFRTGTTSSKPLDPNSTARCYEKPPAVSCDGEAVAVMLPGPSLTEGYPATNPALRLLEFDPADYSLLDATTYTFDIHAANHHARQALVAGTIQEPASAQWTKEYSFRDNFFASSLTNDVSPLTPARFEELVHRISNGTTQLFQQVRGMGDGSLFCSGYNASTAPFTPRMPCKPCAGACATAFVDVMNGTGLH